MPSVSASEIWWAISSHIPNSAYVEASIGINLGAAAFRPIFERVRTSYLGHTDNIPSEFKLNGDALAKVGEHLAAKIKDLDNLGNRCIFWYQLLALFLGLAGLAFLYMDYNPWGVIFLPCPLFLFSLHFSVCARSAVRRIRRNIEGHRDIEGHCAYVNVVTEALSNSNITGAHGAASNSNSIPSSGTPSALSPSPAPVIPKARSAVATANGGSNPPRSNKPKNGRKNGGR